MQNFSDYIRSIERYNDTFSGKAVELPSGYGYTWGNISGENLITDSPSYNPDIGSNIEWRQMLPTQ